jgi:hypothetical protein
MTASVPSRCPPGGTDASHNFLLGGYCAWLIENTCHGSLDITYREDESRVRERHLGENMAWLYRFTLSLLKQHPRGQSLVMKRRCCGWDEKFLLKVLAGAKVWWTLASISTVRTSLTEING